MPKLDDTHVQLKRGIIVWDAITRPDPVPNDPTAKSYAVKIVVDNRDPDVALLNQMATTVLAAHPVFKGVLPAGGRWAITPVNPTDYDGLFPNHVEINCKSRRPPDIRDENGRQLDPMQYGPLMFTGQNIDVVVHTYAYNTASKGVAAGLDGLIINQSAQATPHNFGGGGYNMSSLQYGGVPAQPQQPAQPGYAPPPAQGGYAPPPAQGGYVPPQQPAQGGPAPAPNYNYLPQ